MVFIVFIIIAVVLIAAYVTMYNGLKRSKVQVDEAWSQIDVQIKRRNDLMINI